MFKKLVALVCVAVLCLAVVSEALAATNPHTCNHEWIWQRAGDSDYRTLKINMNKHQLHAMYVKICCYCGSTGGAPTYLPISSAPEEDHVFSGNTYDRHEGTKHYFYRWCNKCSSYYGLRKTLDCPGGNAHVRFKFYD